MGSSAPPDIINATNTPASPQPPPQISQSQPSPSPPANAIFVPPGQGGQGGYFGGPTFMQQFGPEIASMAQAPAPSTPAPSAPAPAAPANPGKYSQILAALQQGGFLPTG